MPAYALYRLPYSQEATFMAQTTGEPDELPSCASLNGREGFVMAPFSADKQHPFLLLQPDTTVTLPVLQLTAGSSVAAFISAHTHGRPANERPLQGDLRHYTIDFANFHSHIQQGEFSKIVLARQAREPMKAGLSPLQLFLKACQAYPRLFIALISTRRGGTWLMSTPEILLSGKEKEWSTMSLAGTMRLTGQQLNFDVPPSIEGHSTPAHGNPDIRWGIKDIQEQRFVSTYITECLERYATSLHEHGPYTMRAGDLVHLRSDFAFTLPDCSHLGDLLQTLYPTPAVCGVPKDAARDFILRNEYAPRSYYSGFAGPLYPEAGTHLYVSLRCMRIDSDGYSLFAGGGLLADSVMKQEWEETEAKLHTMRALLEE